MRHSYFLNIMSTLVSFGTLSALVFAFTSTIHLALGVVNETLSNEGRAFFVSNLEFGLVTRSLHSECMIQSNTLGTCMRPLECVTISGTPTGFCSKTLVCCTVMIKCGSSSNAKTTFMQGSVIYSPNATRCLYTINRFSSYVCQLRLDFTTMLPMPSRQQKYTPPQSYPSCGSSYLSINNFVFCVYIPFGQTTISETLTVLVSANNLASWIMTATQLQCPPDPINGLKYLTSNFQRQLPELGFPLTLNNTFSEHMLELDWISKKTNLDKHLLAPNGCLQYFPSTMGVFESFNYNGGTGPFLPNMNYAICFDRQPATSKIQLYAETFEMSYNNDISVDVSMTDGDCYDEQDATQVISNDYVNIPYSTIIEDGTKAIRYCGNILQDKNLVAPPGPYAVIVNTGRMYQPAATTLNMQPRAFKFFFNLL